MTNDVQGPRLKRIVLHLARSKEFPGGSSRHGYEFIAPLTPDGHIDPETWRRERERCRVRRFWGAGQDEHGHLVHRPGGSWAFHYDAEGEDEDEPGYRFASHVFAPGEYVSLRDEDGELHTFRVAAVERV